MNEALAALTSEFAALYAPIGRPSIPAEKLLRAMLLQAFCSIRSERQLMERLEFDLLFRWFVGLGIDDAVWDHSVFSKNHDRLLEGEIVAKFLNAILAQPRVKRLLSAEHVSVDGTLIEAWASMKSFKPKDGANDPPAKGGGRNKEADFHGEKRSNETHVSTSDPEARLYRKGTGKEAKLCFIGHVLMENRHGLFVDACLTPADGHAERIAALHMIEPRADRPRAITLGADMSAPAGCQLVGRWRIVEADLWDRDYLDLCGPATIVIGAEGRGEITFGAMQATLDIEYSRSSIGFAWTGFDEGDEISGEGTAELLDDGSIEIEFEYHNGDDAVLKAKREPFSTAC